LFFFQLFIRFVGFTIRQ